jgi:rubrerythrin
VRINADLADLIRGNLRSSASKTRRKNVPKKIGLEEAWRMAIQREQDAHDLYQEMAEMVEDSALKSLFEFLVEQEKEHKRRLQEEFDRYFTPEF